MKRRDMLKLASLVMLPMMPGAAMRQVRTLKRLG